MTRKNLTRNALFTSIISLLLCVSMLVGTTFAWFTDSVVSGTNVIASGNLDVELHHSDKAHSGRVDNTTKLFDDVKLWEPGAVAYENFVIANEGTLALKYQMTLNALKATKTPEGKTLADVLQVAVVKGGFEGGRERAHALQNYTNLSSFTLDGKLEGDTKSETYGVVIYWRPDTDHTDSNGNYDNEFNVTGGLTIDLGISLFATQEMHEDDSFGSDYDGLVWDNALKVMSGEELVAAIANGVDVIMLEDDIDLNNALEIPAGAELTLNLNGKTISGSGFDSEGKKAHAINNKGNLLIVGGSVESTGANGGSAIYNAEGAVLTLNDVTVTGAPQSGDGWPSYAINSYGALTIDGANITSTHGAVCLYADTVINNANITMNGFGGSSHVFYIGGEGTDVVINGGTYTHKGNVDGSLAYIMTGATVTVNGGTFSASNGGYGMATYTGALNVNGGTFANAFLDWGGPISISGGTFATKPADKYIAAGHKVVENNGKYVVVADSVDNVIATAADLYALRSTGWSGNVVKGTYELMADIDMTGYDMTPIAVEGEFNFHGNGHTISNLNLVEAEINVATSGLFTARYGGTATNISNLTLENVTSTSSKYSAAVFAYSGNGMAINMNNVDVKNATIKGESAAALVAYATVPVNLTGCDVSGLNLDGAFDENKVGAFVGTANQPSCAVNVSNCTNNTSYCDYGRVVNGATWNGAIGVNSTEALQKALNEATSNTVIELRDDVSGDITVPKKTGINLTIDGKGKTYTGTVTLNGGEDSGNLIIKNIDFVSNAGTDIIVAPTNYVNNGTTYNNYIYNLTVDNCTFTNPKNDQKAVAVRAVSGGHHNWTLKNLTVDNTMHSMYQGGNIVSGFVVDGCKVNSKNGINLNYGPHLNLINSTFDVNGYAVRIGVAGSTVNGTYTIDGCNLKSAVAESDDAVIVFRGTMTGSTMTITNTTLTGTTEILNPAGVTVVK